MGKNLLTIMISVAVVYSCQQRKKVVFYGAGNVIVDDGGYIDTLQECACWKSKDIVKVKIANTGFSGISVDLDFCGLEYNASINYWSDTDEFDGEFDKEIPIESKDVKIEYHFSEDSTIISGELDLMSEAVGSEVIRARGTFSCPIRN